MTIFVEYPILFLGYSLQDTNIQSILQSIMGCLTEPQIETLAQRHERQRVAP